MLAVQCLMIALLAGCQGPRGAATDPVAETVGPPVERSAPLAWHYELTIEFRCGYSYACTDYTVHISPTGMAEVTVNHWGSDAVDSDHRNDTHPQPGVVHHEQLAQEHLDRMGQIIAMLYLPRETLHFGPEMKGTDAPSWIFHVSRGGVGYRATIYDMFLAARTSGAMRRFAELWAATLPVTPRRVMDRSEAEVLAVLESHRQRSDQEHVP